MTARTPRESIFRTWRTEEGRAPSAVAAQRAAPRLRLRSPPSSAGGGPASRFKWPAVCLSARRSLPPFPSPPGGVPSPFPPLVRFALLASLFGAVPSWGGAGGRSFGPLRGVAPRVARPPAAVSLPPPRSCCFTDPGRGIPSPAGLGGTNGISAHCGARLRP